MNWFVGKSPRLGQRRIRTRFAWFPIYIQEPRKSVWLQWVTVEERFSIAGVSEPQFVWVAVREALPIDHEATHIINNPDDYI